MDGWMDGWIDRWMGVWMDLGGWMDGGMDRRMDGWMYLCMYRWMGGCMCAQKKGHWNKCWWLGKFLKI